jgi:DNA-binding NarL/FixJ family response regulator
MTSMHRIRVLFTGLPGGEAKRLEELILSQPDMLVMAPCTETTRIADTAVRYAADIILLHARDPAAGRAAIREALLQVPGTRLLVVLPTVSDTDAASLIEDGARGVMAVNGEYAQGIRAIHAVHAGEIWGSRATLSIIARAAIRHTMDFEGRSRALLALTRRERQIVELLRYGSSNKQIALQLQISDKTVKTHVQNIFSKLQVRRRQMVVTSPPQQ